MNGTQNFRDALAPYVRHGWRLVRVLMTTEMNERWRGEAVEGAEEFEGAPVELSPIDAMWFSRPSHGGCEAWELRLVAEPPYALFELFEPDDPEEDREDVRREMEARLREKVLGE